MASPKQEAPADSGLIERMAAGDERALGALYDRHGAVAYSLARGILKNAADAEEVVADAFVQAWRTAAGFESSRGSVLAWLITITRSRALDRVRSRHRHAKALERAALQEATGFALAPAIAGREPERAVEQEQMSQRVSRTLAELPEPQRRVIELAYFQGMSQSEIAEALGEPLGTIKTRMRTGMEKLRLALRGSDSEGRR
ncbi:MAG: sigma-70 family RNA polymerase sigma factor [Gemmatimonadetes bacterium]|nr:sigma-70 family RNA polymerase sigma factor [Gemmatimonadota bacterium]